MENKIGCRSLAIAAVVFCLMQTAQTQTTLQITLSTTSSVIAIGSTPKFTCTAKGTGNTNPTISWLIKFRNGTLSEALSQTSPSSIVPGSKSFSVDQEYYEDLNLFISDARAGQRLFCSVSYQTELRELFQDIPINTAVNLGEACSSTNACTVTSSQCVQFVCRCDPGYKENGNTQCLPLDLGVTCPVNNAQCRPDNSLCSGGICTCQSGYGQTFNGECSPLGLGSSCTSGNCLPTYSVCQVSTSTCVCGNGYYEVSGISCRKANINENCVSGSCGVSNSICTGTCTCLSGYYAASTSECRAYGGYLDSCVVGASNACTGNTYCDSTSLRCLCSSGYVYIASAGGCVQSYLNDQCVSGSCVVPNSFCTSSLTCACTGNFYAVGTTECRAQGGYGTSCVVGVSDACTGNTYCASGTCLCSPGYFYSNGGCVLQLNLGDSCSSGACSPPNSVCSNSQCACTDLYYPVGNQCFRRDLNAPCVSACAVANSVCTSQTCSCSSNYYPVGSTECRAKATYGNSCETSVFGSCLEANTVCTGNPGTCLCTSGTTRIGNVCSTSGSTTDTCPANTQVPQTRIGDTSPSSPDIYVEATCYLINYGTSRTLPCVDTKGGSLRSGSWEKQDSNGNFIAVSTSTDDIINGYFMKPNMTISNAQPKHAGIYRCTMCYSANLVQCTSSYNVEVKINGTEEPTVPAITAVTVAVADNSSPTKLKGQSVTLACVTTPANAGTNFQWRRNGVALGSTESTYTVASLAPQDTGTYTCTAANQININNPTASTSLALDVQYAPEYSLNTGVDTITYVANLDANTETITCDVSANPSVNTYYFYNSTGGLLRSGPERTFVVNSALGYQRYSCRAENSVGTSPLLYLQVQAAGGGPNIGAATEDDGGISTGAIAAIVLGIIFLLLLIIIIIICCCNYGWCRKKEKVQPEKPFTQPPVRPYIPRVLVSDQASTVSRKDVGIMVNGGTHTFSVTSEEAPVFIEPRYVLKPATTAGPIISMFNEDQPRAHQLPALDTQYLYPDEQPKKKKRRRRKKRTHHEEPEPELRYAEVVPPEQDDDLVVIPDTLSSRHTYYE